MVRTNSLLYLGYTLAEISAHLSVNTRTILHYVERYHLPRNALYPQCTRPLKENLLAGADFHELCALYWITPAFLSRRLIESSPPLELALPPLSLYSWWQPLPFMKLGACKEERSCRGTPTRTLSPEDQPP